MLDTKFYKLLISAKDNEKDFEKLLQIAEPYITKNSFVDKNNVYGSDARKEIESMLRVFLFDLVKSENFANKLASENMNKT